VRDLEQFACDDFKVAWIALAVEVSQAIDDDLEVVDGEFAAIGIALGKPARLLSGACDAFEHQAAQGVLARAEKSPQFLPSAITPPKDRPAALFQRRHCD
jgi:hypothetical protein